ncbi:ribokinase [Micrococcales bacterium 31B]|nr:ribokinase [Micrococcales bacterium 31B]
MPHNVYVIGSISVDLTTFSQRLPQPGETLMGDSFTMVLGGKGANQAIAASRAGAPTRMIGAIGTDPFADIALGGLTADHVETTHLARIEGPTGIAHIRVDANAENNIVVVPHANAEVTTERIDAAAAAYDISAGDVALIQLEIPLDSALRAAEVWHGRGATVILDPAPAQPLPDTVWAHVDLVTPNETEAKILTGIDVTDAESARAAGDWFVSRGVKTAIITLAGSGALIVTAEGARTVASFRVKAVDTTAAGDAFAGALGAAFAAGLEFDAALQRAMAAGALAVTVEGASPSIHTAAQIDAFLAEHTGAADHA